MDGEALPLFSFMGHDTSVTTQFPTSYLEESAATLTLIRNLFSLLATASGNEHIVEIDKITFFQQELKYLFCEKSDTFYDFDIRNGINRLNEHFISKDKEIQRRANAFIRICMYTAECLLYGECKCCDPNLIQKDQSLVNDETISDPHTILPSNQLGNMTPPSSPQRSRSASTGGLSPAATRSMFRSNSIKLDYLKASPKSMFEFDEDTEKMFDKFLLNEYTDKERMLIDPRLLSEEKRVCLIELWDYFDPFDQMSILEKQDIASGFIKWGSHYIATDPTCQLLANFYCQKKLKAAIAAFYSSQYSAQSTANSHSNSRNTSIPSDNANSIGLHRNESEILLGTRVAYKDPNGNSYLGVIVGTLHGMNNGNGRKSIDPTSSLVYELEIPELGVRYVHSDAIVIVRDDSYPLNSVDLAEQGGLLGSALDSAGEKRERGLSFNLPSQRRGRSESESYYGTNESPSVPISRSRSGSVTSPSFSRRMSRSNSMGQHSQQTFGAGNDSSSNSSIMNNYNAGNNSNSNNNTNIGNFGLHRIVDDSTVAEASRLLAQLTCQENTAFVNAFKIKKSNTEKYDETNLHQFPMLNNFVDNDGIASGKANDPSNNSDGISISDYRPLQGKSSGNVDYLPLSTVATAPCRSLREDDADSVGCVADNDSIHDNDYGNYPYDEHDDVYNNDTDPVSTSTAIDREQRATSDEDWHSYLKPNANISRTGRTVQSTATNHTNIYDNILNPNFSADDYIDDDMNDEDLVRMLQERGLFDTNTATSNDGDDSNANKSQNPSNEACDHDQQQQQQDHPAASESSVVDDEYDNLLDTLVSSSFKRKPKPQPYLTGTTTTTLTTTTIDSVATTINTATTANEVLDDIDVLDDAMNVPDAIDAPNDVTPDTTALDRVTATRASWLERLVQQRKRVKQQRKRELRLKHIQQIEEDTIMTGGKPMTSSEREILKHILQQTGPSFALLNNLEDIIPQYEDRTYYLWFNVSGRTRKYHFCQKDFGVSFRKFCQENYLGCLFREMNNYNSDDEEEVVVEEEVVAEADLDLDQLKESTLANSSKLNEYIRHKLLQKAMNETNRCFYLHLGLGIGIHPFALQALFRLAAADILSRPDDEKCQFFGECLAPKAEFECCSPGLLNRGGVFTDAMALCAIWPVEMDEYRLLICQLNSDNTLLYYTVFEPEHGPHDDAGQWVGKDLFMTNQNGHFTLLAALPGKPLVNATVLIASASQAVEENPDMASVMTYIVSVNKDRRYSLADVLHLLDKEDEEDEAAEGSVEKPTVDSKASTTDQTNTSKEPSEVTGSIVQLSKVTAISSSSNDQIGESVVGLTLLHPSATSPTASPQSRNDGGDGNDTDEETGEDCAYDSDYAYHSDDEGFVTPSLGDIADSIRRGY